MIDVRGLGHRFGLIKVALDEVAFSVPEGSVCAVLGRNGSGKTTLLRILAGVLPPPWGGRPGRVSVCGFDPDDSTLDIRRVSGYLPAAGPLGFRHRVADLVRLHAQVYPGLSEEGVLRRIQGAQVDVGARLKDLSRGELRRVLAALVFERDPPCLILDEPTDGLDPEAAERLLQEVRARALRAGRCTLLATHRPEEVERICDRVLLLRGGKVLLTGDLDELKDSWSRLIVRVSPGFSPGRVGSSDPAAPEQWEGVVSIERGEQEWIVTVAGDATAIAARLEEHGASEIEGAPIPFRELYLAAMGSAADPATGDLHPPMERGHAH